MNVICSIYKSSKKDEMYLYMKKGAGLEDLPEALSQVFGKPIHVMDMLLNEEKALARASSAEVIKDIEEKGFFLQMPPAREPGYKEFG